MPSSPTPAPERGPVGPGPDDKRLRAASRLAIEVAIAGEGADPREPAPAALRPLLGFTRLSAASYRVIHRAIDDDGVFRARVAAAADEAAVGRVGWLWLHRPVGWLDDPALVADAPPDVVDERSDRSDRPEREAAAKHRRAAKDADAARRRAEEQLAEVRRELRRTTASEQELRQRVAELEDARATALRSAKDLEAKLAESRRDLKVARRATREAEAELVALRSTPSPPSGDASPPTMAPPDAAAPAATPVPPRAEAPELAAEVADAARAAAALADALGRAAARLAPRAADPQPPPSAPAAAPRARGRAAAAGAARGRKRAARALPALPPGVFDGSPEADRHLLGDPANLVVVDGYNLARTAWSGLRPEEERQRTVQLLEEVQARSGGQVLVVFDGDDAVVAPVASRRVRIRFSATGQTADDAIVDLLDALAPTTPAVVVSSDRAVVRDARSLGAATMSSAAMLAAAGR